MALRFIDEPADIIGNPFDKPAGSARAWSVGIVAGRATVLLENVNLLVEQRSQGLAVELVLEPAGIGSDAGATGCGHSVAGSECHAECLGRLIAVARQHRCNF